MMTGWFREIARRGWVWLLPIWLVIACGSSDSDDDNTPKDTTTEVAQDVTDDSVTDDAAQPDTNVEPDDTAEPDEAEQDVPADLPWEELPTLPPEKEFTTRYVAGAARIDTSPDKPTLMGGFGFCMGKIEGCRVSEGIHDPIEINAVALGDTETGEVVVFVAVDSVGFFKYDVDLIHNSVPDVFQERFGVKMEGPRVMVGASHAHSAPDTCGIWAPMDGPEREEEEYIAFVRETVVEAAAQAFENLDDIEMTWGKGSAINHTDDSFIDQDIFAIKGVRPGGEVVFTLTRWNAHPTCYGHTNLALSGDYLGTFRKTIIDQVGGVAVYMNGCIGSTYSDTPEGCQMEDLFPEGYQHPDVGHNKAVCVGVNLAEQTVAALEDGQPVAETGIEFRHRLVPFHPDNAALMTLGQIGPVPIPEVDLNDPEDMMDTHFSWVTLGDLEYVTTPGESFPSFGKDIKDILGEKGKDNVVVLGLTQDWMGYLMTPEQWADDDPELNYYKGLSPGVLIHPAYMEVFQELVDEEL